VHTATKIKIYLERAGSKVLQNVLQYWPEKNYCNQYCNTFPTNYSQYCYCNTLYQYC